MRWVVTLLIGGTLSAASVAEAEERLLRVASIAPEGTGWDKQIRAMSHTMEHRSNGALRVKVYSGAIAGGEMEQLDRLKRGQLDAICSGQMACQAVIPSMRVLRLPGVFQSRDEATYVTDRLLVMLQEEAEQHGVVLITTVGLGPDVVFTRRPVRTFDELKRTRLWRWDLDEVGIATSRAMGLQIVPAPVEEAWRRFNAGEFDGFLAIPTAALAFQWSTQAPHIIDLRDAYIYGCVLFSQASFQRLSLEQQSVVRAAANEGRARLDEVGRQMDEALLGGAFARQGVQVAQAAAPLRAQYFAASRTARDSVTDKLVPGTLIKRVLEILADFRAENQKARR
jgi:TRAP-type C4-dicarboxylate transport system substrate-binding protein